MYSRCYSAVVWWCEERLGISSTNLIISSLWGGTWTHSWTHLLVFLSFFVTSCAIKVTLVLFGLSSDHHLWVQLCFPPYHPASSTSTTSLHSFVDPLCLHHQSLICHICSTTWAWVFFHHHLPLLKLFQSWCPLSGPADNLPCTIKSCLFLFSVGTVWFDLDNKNTWLGLDEKTL